MDRRRLGAAGAGLLILALAVPVGTMAQDSRLSKFQRLDVGNVDTSLLNAVNPKAMTKIIVELGGKPVALHQADARALGRTLTKDQKAAVRAGLKATQDKLVPQLKGLGAKVLAQYQDAYNGIKIQVAAGQVGRISKLAGVVGVHKVAVYRPDNTNTVPFLNAPTAWQSLGFTGAGVKVAIIDTGIDYYHANFGGSGDVADFEAADGLGTDGVFPTTKVAGGYDFVGDDYDASGTGLQVIPNPDSDPLDCNGHGSHVGGTTAGFGVLDDGTTYSGSYDTTTIGGNSWAIGPGVAPEATLYAYRVFGCDGSTDVVVDAINQAVADGVDVINMSLGSPFGQVGDPDAVASDNAALAGVVVVASAGNAGANPMITGGPSSGDRVIAVAAQEGVAGFGGATIDLGAGLTGINANGSTALPVTGNLRVLMNGGSIALGCSAADYAAVQPGEIVVTKRGTCARVDRATYGQAAGAAAVIMVNNATDLPPYEGTIPGVTIPFIGFSSTTEAAFIAADGEEHTLTATTIANPSYKKVASFSSGGPREYDNALKPDVSAPGVSVLSTAVGTGWHGTRISGTSMAAPATAGVAALVVDAHPGWTPEQVKAALMNTADASSAHMASYNIRTAGAGTVQADKAIQTIAFATTGGGTASLSFGYDPNNGAYSETKAITISNHSGSAITYTFAVDWNSGSAGAAVTFSPSSIKVPAHGSKSVNVKLSLSNSAMTNNLPSVHAVSSTSIVTLRGTVRAIPTVAGAGRYTLRVPFLAVPRPLSNITAGLMTPYSLDGSVASATVPLTNSGIHYGAADVYAWGFGDDNDGLPMTDLRAVGMQSFDVGGDRLIVFAINTWGRFGNPAAAEWDVWIDADGDFSVDHLLVGYDLGALTTGSFNGQLAAFLLDESYNLVAVYSVAAPINGSTVELPVYASDLGITGSNNSYYYASTLDLITGATDEAYYGSFDAYDPAMSQGDWFDMNRWDNAPLSVWVDLDRLGDLPAEGWMVVTLDDANGAAQADLIPFGTLPTLP